MARHTSLCEYWRANPSAMIDALMQYKMIYFNIWDVIHMLNAHFGWTMAAICIQNFMDVLDFLVFAIGKRCIIFDKYYMFC